MKNWCLMAFFFLAVSAGFAQGKVTGMVYDENGPLPGANIVIEGTATGVASDFDGHFSINTASANGEVVISF
ncbi:MAG: carboxypeptidase-like regulatory domain-containing protein [Flavobacterium sp.]